MDKLTAYIIDFLARISFAETGIIHYGKIEDASDNAKIIIIPAFSGFNITNLPETPFKRIDNTMILYGDSIVERKDGLIIVHADIIASSFFLLSRYEEILKPKCRDRHGRFLAKDSIIFQQGYGDRPLVDEYGVLLRNWLRETGVDIPDDKKGFNKIYLTHDIDNPYRFHWIGEVCRQYIKNILRNNYCSSPLKKYFDRRNCEYYTFHKIIEYDKHLQESLPEISVESIYFLITAGSSFNKKYYNFFSEEINCLIDELIKSGAKLGLHASYEAGKNPKKIKYEAKRLKNKLGIDSIINRHHYLQWREPGDVEYMEQAEITDDFTFSYADCAGFRVGTCRPYRFINPETKELTNVIIHPMEIMECTLDRQEYMHLNYENAFEKCRKIIRQVYKHNGELVLLWHNTEFTGKGYQERLYKSVLEYIKAVYDK